MGPPGSQPGPLQGFGGPPGPLQGLAGSLGRLLPRGLDTEELLVLAVLLLAMKQEGAAPVELLIAAALYLWLQ